jgi:hypothetical protein
MSQFDCPIAKQIETMEASQNKRFYRKLECLLLWFTYIGEKRRGVLWAKNMGLKRSAIGNTLGKHIGNLRNMNKGKMKKILSPPQPTPQT